MESYLTIKCICGSSNYIKLFDRKDKEHNFEIIKCQHCGLCRTVPIPDASTERYRHYGIKRYLKNKRDAVSFMKRILKEVLKFKKIGRLLEVGCSVGYFLKLVQDKGFEVRGAELDANAVEYANKLLGAARVSNTPLEEAQFTNYYFDVIVMSHLLEHIENPSSFLKEAKRILKNDGIIVVVSPNFESFCAKLKKEKWPGLRPEEHVWQLGIGTLTRLLKEEGFKVVSAKTSGLYYNFVQVMHGIIENAKSGGSPKHIIYSLLNWLVGKFGHGDNMFIVAIKQC